MSIIASNGSNGDVQAKINAAIDGDTITLPSGSFTWTGQVSVTGKTVKFQGAGSGRIVARSTSSVTIGTGAKSFTLNVSTKLPVIEALKSALTNGTTVRVSKLGSVGNYVEGTVTGLSGDVLTINATSSGGSGTHAIWTVATTASTTVIHSAGTDRMFLLQEHTTGNVELSGIKFEYGTGTGEFVFFYSAVGGLPVLIHDCWFNSSIESSHIRTSSNRGIIWNCSFSTDYFSLSSLPIHHKDAANSDLSASGSWERVSTMGTADTTGKSNLYIEDCDFHAFANSGDADDNARVVIRKNLFNNSGYGSHGADTSIYGMRHMEVYGNEFIFNDQGGSTFNLQHWLYLRGGTGVITDNVMPDISSMAYGNKSEVRIQLQNLQRNSGPHPLWGKDIAGVQYPAPRQFGMGYVTGAGGSDAYTYNGDSEPLYQWSNTGGGNYATPSIENYSTPSTGEDDIADYIQVGRDYLNATKPGWTAYTYPHPLRTSTPVVVVNSGGAGAGLSNSKPNTARINSEQHRALYQPKPIDRNAQALNWAKSQGHVEKSFTPKRNSIKF